MREFRLQSSERLNRAVGKKTRTCSIKLNLALMTLEESGSAGEKYLKVRIGRDRSKSIEGKSASAVKTKKGSKEI